MSGADTMMHACALCKGKTFDETKLLWRHALQCSFLLLASVLQRCYPSCKSERSPHSYSSFPCLHGRRQLSGSICKINTYTVRLSFLLCNRKTDEIKKAIIGGSLINCFLGFRPFGSFGIKLIFNNYNLDIY